MKKLLLILFVSFIFSGCEKENEYSFDVNVDTNLLSFEPVPGGAVMHYKIPSGSNVHSVCISYKNSLGEQMNVRGSYGSESLEIKGFIDKQDAVQAQVYYISYNNSQSKPIDVKFSTEASGAVAVFENLKVEPYWNGFMVIFDAPENVDGFINIGYVGINPFTGEKDILLKETKIITSGTNRLLYGDISDQAKDIEAVVWTEDFMQNEARRETYNVRPMIVTQLSPSLLSYTGDTYEIPEVKIGAQYLFDGDTKGINKISKKDGDYAFTTFKSVMTEPIGIIDLKEPHSIAKFRIYAPLNINIKWSAYLAPCPPSHFIVYAGNDINAPEQDWVMIDEYHQSINISERQWWCFPFFNPAIQYKSEEELQAAEPCYCQVDFDVTTEKYRYIRVKYLEYFGFNGKGRIMSSEMEVYVSE